MNPPCYGRAVDGHGRGSDKKATVTLVTDRLWKPSPLDPNIGKQVRVLALVNFANTWLAWATFLVL